MTTTATPRTRTIAGCTLTLLRGVRYRASRPFARRGLKVYPVTITPLHAPGVATLTIDGLSYEQANALINRFNAGQTSFDGRVW